MDKEFEFVWVIDCTEWDSPDVHRTAEGARASIQEYLEETFKEYGEDEGWEHKDLEVAITFLNNSFKQVAEGSNFFCCRTDIWGDFRVYKMAVEE